MNIEIINSPASNTMDIILRRIMDAKFKDNLKQKKIESIGLIQGNLSELIAASDLAEKSSGVMVCEISGICPQHITMIGIFGDTASVQEAIKAIEAKLKKNKVEKIV